MRNDHKKLIIIILLMIIIITAAVFYFEVIKPRQKPQNIQINGLMLAEPKQIDDFQLVDNTGKNFTRANLQGHWTMLFFGFTNCGDVCPTTMAALNEMYQTLQRVLPDKQLPQVVMISVDPDRDSVARMNDYVLAFNPHFIGARGAISETIALEKQLHIAAAKLQVKGTDRYTINHSADILLINPQAELQAFLSYPHQPEQMVRDYKLILVSSAK